MMPRLLLTGGDSMATDPVQPQWKARVYALDDSRVVRVYLQKALRELLYDTVTFERGEEALAAIRKDPPDMVLTDLNMPDMDGFAFIEEHKKAAPHVPVVMLTGSAQLGDALRAIRLGATDYVTKPIDPKHLQDVMTRILRMAELEAENRRHVEELARRDEKMRQEMELARAIHHALIPANAPSLPGFDFAVSFIPSGEIGGDYIDYFPSENGRRVGILFADLTGHGVPAALLVVMFKTYAGDLLRSNLSPSAKISALNRRLSKEFPMGHFASTTYVEFVAGEKAFTYVKASQEPAIVFRASGAVDVMKDGGPLLGAFDPELFGEPNYPESRVELATGDTVFLYTDGLVEVENSAGVMLGLEGLMPWIKEELHRPPAELLPRIHERIVAYAGRTELPDDFTALAVRVKE